MKLEDTQKLILKYKAEIAKLEDELDTWDDAEFMRLCNNIGYYKNEIKKLTKDKM